MSNQEHAELRLGDLVVKLPVVRGTEGEVAVDVSKLRAETGLITLDSGYGNTGACKSAITFIDGEKGILRYRGYPIEELATGCSFLDVAHLLIEGELPTPEQQLADEVTHHTMLQEDYRRFFEALPADAHPMPVLAAAVGALATFYKEPETPEEIHQAIVRLLAKMPTLAAYSYKRSIRQPFVYPNNRLDYCKNFLHLMFATPCEDYEVDPIAADVLNLLLILHADHEQNCSTSAVRLVGSSRTHLYASISAGISALWGELHGGANQKVIEMLESIADNDGSADDFMQRAKDKGSTARLMGFGHRVYKSYDPRATILKAACGEVIKRSKGSEKLLDIAMRLEELALSDDYFISRNLYPNVDFYSGIIYQALGIPKNTFTVLFAMGRLPGWIAQWREMRNDPEFRLARPRQVYVGATKRPLPR